MIVPALEGSPAGSFTFGSHQHPVSSSVPNMYAPWTQPRGLSPCDQASAPPVTMSHTLLSAELARDPPSPWESSCRSKGQNRAQGRGFPLETWALLPCGPWAWEPGLLSVNVLTAAEPREGLSPFAVVRPDSALVGSPFWGTRSNSVFAFLLDQSMCH